MASGLPERVAQFVDAHIHSVEQLEVLLLLREEQDEPWTAESVGRRLHTLPGSAARRLADLAARGFVSESGGAYRFTAGAHEPVVDELAECYARRRVSVIAAIFAREPDSIRSFADAFRFMDEEDS